MGINTHYYTFYGVKLVFGPLSSHEENDEFHEALYDRATPDFDSISDGMGGEYLLLGKILFNSGDLRYNDIEDTWVNIPLDKLSEIDVEWRKAFKETFPQWANIIDDKPSILITFMHLS
jgi:hypothetical protein